MPHPFRHDKPFAGAKRDDPSRRDPVGIGLEIDEEPPFQYEEELIVVGVLVPVVFAGHDAEPDDGIVYAREGLIVPGVRHRPDERVDIDVRQRRKEDVQPRVVRKVLRIRFLSRHVQWLCMKLRRCDSC